MMPKQISGKQIEHKEDHQGLIEKSIVKSVDVRDMDTMHKEDEQNYETQNVLDLMRYTATNYQTSDEKDGYVFIDVDTWNIILSTVDRMEKICQSNQRKIDELMAMAEELASDTKSTSTLTVKGNQLQSNSTTIMPFSMLSGCETEVPFMTNANYYIPSFDHDENTQMDMNVCDDRYYLNMFDNLNDEYENNCNMETNVI